MTDVDQFSSSTAIDQESITRTGGGALQVSKPSQKIVGDFEASIGSWSKYGTLDKSRRNEKNSATRGSYVWELTANTSGHDGGIERNIDASGFQKLKLDLYSNGGEDTFYIEIDGTEVLTEANIVYESREYSLDISEKTGTITVRLGVRYENDFITADIDNVRAVKAKKTSFNGAGN